MSVVIIGGGITGLSTAYYLHKLSTKVANKIVIIESSKRVGGWLRSVRNEDGLIHELGPKSIRISGEAGLNTLQLAEELNLSDEIIGVSSKDSASNKRLIADDKELHYLPSKFSHLFARRPPFTKPFYQYLFHDLRTPKLSLNDSDNDISVYDFMKYRFGEDIAEFLAVPLCRGITAGDAKKLSMKSLFPDMFQAEQSSGSVVKGMFFPIKKKMTIRNANSSPLIDKIREKNWTIWSCRNGIETFPQYLLNYLSKFPNDIEIKTCTNVEQIQFTTNGKSQVTLIDSMQRKANLTADHLFSTISSQALAKCLKDSEQLSMYLNQIKSVNVSVVNLEYSGKNLFKFDGFGFLTLSNLNTPVLGAVFDSCCFPIHDADKKITRITVMLGGEYFEHFLGDVDKVDLNKLLDISVNAVEKYLHIKEKPIRNLVTINKNCIPQYYLGHENKVRAIENEITRKGLKMNLLGSSFYGVSVNDCILNAKRAALKYVE